MLLADNLLTFAATRSGYDAELIFFRYCSDFKCQRGIFIKTANDSTNDSSSYYYFSLFSLFIKMTNHIHFYAYPWVIQPVCLLQCVSVSPCFRVQRSCFLTQKQIEGDKSQQTQRGVPVSGRSLITCSVFTACTVYPFCWPLHPYNHTYWIDVSINGNARCLST